MIWFWIVLVIILFIGMMIFLRGVHKVNTNDKVFVRYLFAYRIIKDGNIRGMPTDFLVDWQISNLENRYYLLYLTLEEDLDIERYLHRVWVDYEGLYNVYIDVYKVEEDTKHTKHILIGKFCIEEGKMGYASV